MLFAAVSISWLVSLASRLTTLFPASSLLPAVIAAASFSARILTKSSLPFIPAADADPICWDNQRAISFSSKLPSFPAAIAIFRTVEISSSRNPKVFLPLSITLARSVADAPEAVAYFISSGSHLLAVSNEIPPSFSRASSVSAASSFVPPP